MKNIIKLIVVLFILNKSIYANGINIPYQDLNAAGRGDAVVASVSNASAVHYNPAGLSNISKNQFQINVWNLLMQYKYKGPNDLSEELDEKVVPIPSVFLGIPLNDKFTFGLGVYVPFGSSTEWKENGALRSFATENTLINYVISPSLSYKINDALSLGAGLKINYIDLDLQRGVLIEGDQSKFDADGFGIGGNVGIMFKPNDKNSFGLTYRSKGKVDVEGDFSFKSKIPELIPSFNLEAESEIEMPQQISVGYALSPSDSLQIEVNATWTDWTSLDTLEIKPEVGDSVSEALNWSEALIYNVGVTKTFDNGFYTNFGYRYSEKVGHDATFNPRVPDLDIHILSIGAGYDSDNWNFGLSYQYAFGKDRSVNNSAVSPFGLSADGDYEYTGHGLSLGMTIYF